MITRVGVGSRARSPRRWNRGFGGSWALKEVRRARAVDVLQHEKTCDGYQKSTRKMMFGD
jgi:hypothetical protein